MYLIDKMKKMKKLLIIILVGLILPACTEKFEEINTPPTSLSSVPSEFVLTQSIYSTYRDKGGYWTQDILRWGAWIQHYGNHNQGFTTAHYQDIANYNDGFWNTHFGILGELEQAKLLIADQEEGDVARVKNAIIEIMQVVVWLRLTDMVGDVPYSQALQGSENVTPVYDDQQSVYTDLISRMQAAVGALNVSDGPYYGSADVFFQGDVEKWIRFGNAYLMRMGLHLSNADAGKAQSVVSAQMNANLPSGNDDNAILPVIGNDVNQNAHGLVELSRRTLADFPYIGEKFVNVLKDLSDPRLPIVVGPTPASVAAGGALEYVGVPPALSAAQYADVNANLSSYSRPNFDWIVSESSTRGLNAMTYAEVSFMKAEAALRGWGGTETDAQNYFEDGIRAALAMNPFPDAGISASDIEDYIAANGTLTGSFAEKLEQIITQKWITYAFDQPDEAYVEWRRTGFPTLDPGQNQGDTGGTIPRRFRYSDGEAVLNQANYNAAVGKLSNGDTYTSRIWLDK